MTRISRDDVTKAFGPVDDVTIAQIIGTGATKEELAEAKAWIANDEPLMNAGKPLAKGRVGELVDILTELEDSEEDKDKGRPLPKADPRLRRRPCRAPYTNARPGADLNQNRGVSFPPRVAEP